MVILLFGPVFLPRFSLSLKFGVRPNISQEVRSFFIWDQTLDWVIAESKAN